MTTEQQRLHDQHKARLARIQNKAYRPPETIKPVARTAASPVEKFNTMAGGFPRVGNAGRGEGPGNAARDAGHAATAVQSETAPAAARPSKSSPVNWFHIAGAHLTVRDIQDTVIAYFRMSRVELFAKRRSKATVRRRHIAIYLSKVLTIQSLPEIGMRFGGLDHTTILYASRKIERELPLDAALARDVAEIERTLAALNEARAQAQKGDAS